MIAVNDIERGFCSKRFTCKLIEEVLPKISPFLTEEELEEIEVGSWKAVFEMVDFPSKVFNIIFNILSENDFFDKKEKEPLLEAMRQDPRFTVNDK